DSPHPAGSLERHRRYVPASAHRTVAPRRRSPPPLRRDGPNRAGEHGRPHPAALTLSVPPSSVREEPLEGFAVSPRGREAFAARELAELGSPGEPEVGGVSWQGDSASLYAANRPLRTATRVVVRAATFQAKSFFALERHIPRIDWARYLAAGQAVRL